MAQTTAGRSLIDIVKGSKRDIAGLAQLSTKRTIDPDDTNLKPKFASLEQALSVLESADAGLMTPEIKQQSQAHLILRVICLDARFHFPPAWKERARKLYERFEAENWGAMAEIKDEEDTEGVASSGIDAGLSDADDAVAGPERPAKRRKSVAQPKGSGANVSGDYKIIQPPTNHPIWGEKGIMHGIALRLKDGGSLSKGLNPAYEKRDPKVYGHNGIAVGQWYANRLAAIFGGAHGASQAGISGNNGTGAYSVVVSGQYEDLDVDAGEVVYYSGSGSHDNEDPNRPAKSTTGTRILHASLKHGKVLRLLRTSSADFRHAPVEGLRYDGLYKVVDMKMPLNARGGKYEQFKLVRQPKQPTLAECRNRPTAEELRAYNKINAGYNGYGMNRGA